MRGVTALLAATSVAAGIRKAHPDCISFRGTFLGAHSHYQDTYTRTDIRNHTHVHVREYVQAVADRREIRQIDVSVRRFPRREREIGREVANSPSMSRRDLYFSRRSKPERRGQSRVREFNSSVAANDKL